MANGSRQGYQCFIVYVMGVVEELKGEKLGVELGGVWCGGLLIAGS